jgi:very-short-patch-repair endonuclease
MMGYKFLRQKPIDNYIVDFFCQELMLAVEVDGVSHDYKADSDMTRQRRLENLGIKTIRFMDSDIKRNMDGVLMMLRQCIEKIEG